MEISRSRFSSTFLVILLDLKSMALIATVLVAEGCCALEPWPWLELVWD